MDLTNPLVYGAPCFIIFILLELTYSKNHDDHHDLYDWNDLFASGFMGVGLFPLFPGVISVLWTCSFSLSSHSFSPATFHI